MKRIAAMWLMLMAMCAAAQGQGERRTVLFVGNSYTSVNNLPQMTAQVAESMGDGLVYEASAPGGCTFSTHCVNETMALIEQGGWDAVVLQEQSQLPSFPDGQVEAEVFPYAAQLVTAVYEHNPCSEPMFYMTWGRRDGDPQNARYFPVLATYEGMDSMLYIRYIQMGADNDASVCPVGRVWRRLRAGHPEIELYAADGSHPSTAGSYAAACAFYVMLFGRSTQGITFNGGLDEETAMTIREAVEQVVYEHLEDWKRRAPVAAFSYDDGVLTNLSAYADSYEWDFGDGSPTDTACNPEHSYTEVGSHTITLVASRHCMSDTAVLTTGEPLGVVRPDADRGSVTVMVYDLTGRLRAVLPKGEWKVQADEGLPAGVYVLRSGSHSRKIIVGHQ